MGKDKGVLTERQEKFLKVLDAVGGNISAACHQCGGMSRNTFYEWKKEATFADAYNEIVEGLIDYAESQLMQQITAGNTSATIFFLKTKGKERGYVEKTEQELSLDARQPINISIVRDGRGKDSAQ